MKAAQILKLNPDVIQLIAGSENAHAVTVHTPETADKGSLVFISQPEQLVECLSRKATIIIAAFDVPKGSFQLGADQALFRTQKMNLAMSWILPLFDRKEERFQWGAERHSSAYVDSTAQLGAQVKVGPGAFIGANTVIGQGTLIGANAVIENDVVIGQNCIIHPLAFIGAQTVMGQRCEIQPHATLGPDGFGYATDSNGRQRKIPQLGKVVLGDDVEIGANTTIDRATLTETKIASGTKFDKSCHLAHNCEIGKNSLIAAGFMTAGSTKIGANFMTGGNSVVSDHITIADNVMLAGRSTVTNDIETSGAYGGYPLQSLKDSLKSIACLAHLPKMRRQLAAIAKKLGIEDTKK